MAVETLAVGKKVFLKVFFLNDRQFTPSPHLWHGHYIYFAVDKKSPHWKAFFFIRKVFPWLDEDSHVILFRYIIG